MVRDGTSCGREPLIAAVRNGLGLAFIGKRTPMEDALAVGLFSGSMALTLLGTIGVALFWMVVGWRAMRAHEKIAAAAEALSRRSS